MKPYQFLALPVLLAALSADGEAQACTSALTADTAFVSVSSGGVQTIGVQVTNAGTQVLSDSFVMLGSFAGTAPGHPHLAYGGLFLNVDRYTLRCLNGQSRLIRAVGGGGPSPNWVPLDAQGNAQMQIVVPAAAYPWLVGRTVQHGIHGLDISLLPACGSNTIALTFTP